MHFVVCSRYSGSNIGAAFGQPEYSYYFVLKEFVPLLKRLGQVTVAGDEHEAARIYTEHRDKGEQCFFLQFTAPHNTAHQLSQGVIPVFAWEFDSIPNEIWDGDGYNNWQAVLLKWGVAITHSQSTVKAVRSALGDSFPIIAVPAPVWDRCDGARTRLEQRLAQMLQPRTIEFTGVVCDSNSIDFRTVVSGVLTERSGSKTDGGGGSQETAVVMSLGARWSRAKELSAQIYTECVSDLISHSIKNPLRVGVRKLRLVLGNQQQIPSDTETEATDQDRQNLVALSGVVYTSIFNPEDGRKNWHAMLTAFCWAFRDIEDATLLIKLSSSHIVEFSDQVVAYLGQVHPFKCRVVIIKAFLDEQQYQNLIDSTSYYVNTSYGEGQCLPLMEFLSSGTPALAPKSSAMADYMSEEIGFVVDSRPEPTHWQHDSRQMIRTFHYRVDWLSVVQAFKNSYRLMHEDREAYKTMSWMAAEQMKAHCSIDALKEPLKSFLNEHCFHEYCFHENGSLEHMEQEGEREEVKAVPQSV